jgi:(p)ppGpp synthase/HD superfamily hydrolase
MFDLFKTLLPRETFGWEKDWMDFRLFAIQCHGKQMYGDLPYAFHLAMVENILIEFGYGEREYIAAAWLHDILEDTYVTLQQICNMYGGRIAALVHACTGEGEDRTTRNISIYKKLKEFPDAAPIKCIDRMTNMHNCFLKKNSKLLDRYLEEWPEFKKNVEPLMMDFSRDRVVWSELENLIQAIQEERKFENNDNQQQPEQ